MPLVTSEDITESLWRRLIEVYLGKYQKYLMGIFVKIAESHKLFLKKTS